MNLNEILTQKTTWAGLAYLASTALPQFGVAPNLVSGIQSVILALSIIFLRQAIAKDKTTPPANP